MKKTWAEELGTAKLEAAATLAVVDHFEKVDGVRAFVVLRDSPPAPTPAPWHDTPRHQCGGPVVAFSRGRSHPAEAGDVRHVRCAACGDDWIEEDIARLVHVWWSEGAADAREQIEGK